VNNTEIKLKIGEKSYELVKDCSSEICQRVFNKLPLIGEVINVQGEIFFTVDLNIPYSLDDAKDEFEIGDVAYWISPDGSMKAIALFYGNTVYKDGTKPRAYSRCIKIASLKNIDPAELIDIKDNTAISLLKG